MATIAELLLKVDSSQLVSATAALNKFTNASDKATSALSGKTKAQRDSEKAAAALAKRQEAFTNRLNKEIAGLEGGRSASLKYQAQLLGLGNAVDPLINNIEKLTIAKKKESSSTNLSSKRKEIQLTKEQAEAERQRRVELEASWRAAQERQRALSTGPISRGGDLTSEDTPRKGSYTQADIAAQNAAMSRAVVVNKELASATKQATTAGMSQEAQLEKLKASIDPVSASIKRLQQQQRELSKFRSLGLIDEKEYNRLSTQVGETTKRLNTLGATTGKTAKEIAFSMRGLPAQFTDIAVSLQGGQKPLTVFLQQGGQLKDMFGGIRPALQAMGKYVLGLITPLNLGIAAFTALGIAAFQGSREIEQLNKSLILTGRDTAATLAQLRGLNTELADETGETVGKIAKVLTQVARNSKITTNSFGLVTKAAIDMERATGQAVEETIAQFVKIGEDPVAAAKSLDEEYNFLTSSIYANILSLQDQGREAEASSLLMEEFARVTSERSARVEENLGYVEKAWRAVKSAATDTWDYLRNIGRAEEEAFVDPMVAEAQRALDDARVIDFGKLSDILGMSAFGVAKKAAEGVGSIYNSVSETVSTGMDSLINNIEAKEQESLRRRNESRAAIGLTPLVSIKSLEQELSLAEQQSLEREKLLNEEIAALEEANNKREAEKKRLLTIAQDDSWLGEEHRLIKEYENSLKEISKAMEAWGGDIPAEVDAALTGRSEAALKKLEDYRKRVASAATPRERAVRETEAQKRLNALKQQQAVLEAQRDENGKLTKQAQDLLKFDKEIENIKNEKILTAEQKSILANENLIRLQLQKNADIAQEIVDKERLAKLDKLRANIQDEVAAAQANYAANLLGARTSDREADRLREQAKLTDDLNAKRRELKRQFDEGSLDEDSYKESIKIEEEGYRKLLSAQKSYNQETDKLRGDWTAGAEKSFSNFIDAAGDTAGQTQALFDNALNGISDTLVDLVTTGKASFKDLANSILKEITKIATNKALSALLSGIGGSGIFGGALSFLAQADGGAWNNGVQMFASGGAFTNSVVSRPTAFQHSNGLGVLGEAGPEAILPLTRTSDGKLGVQSVGAAGSTVVAPVSVIVNTDSGGSSATPGQTDSSARAIQMAVKLEAERAIQNGLKVGGSIYRAIRGR